MTIAQTGRRNKADGVYEAFQVSKNTDLICRGLLGRGDVNAIQGGVNAGTGLGSDALGLGDVIIDEIKSVAGMHVRTRICASVQPGARAGRFGGKSIHVFDGCIDLVPITAYGAYKTSPP